MNTNDSPLSLSLSPSPSPSPSPGVSLSLSSTMTHSHSPAPFPSPHSFFSPTHHFIQTHDPLSPSLSPSLPLSLPLSLSPSLSPSYIDPPPSPSSEGSQGAVGFLRYITQDPDTLHTLSASSSSALPLLSPAMVSNRPSASQVSPLIKSGDYLFGIYRVALLFSFTVTQEYKILDRSDTRSKYKIVWKEMKKEKKSAALSSLSSSSSSSSPSPLSLSLPPDVDSFSTLLSYLSSISKSHASLDGVLSRLQIQSLFMSRIFTPYQDLVTLRFDRGVDSLYRHARSRAIDSIYNQTEWVVTKVVVMYQMVSLLYLAIISTHIYGEEEGGSIYLSDSVTRSLESIVSDVSHTHYLTHTHTFSHKYARTVIFRNTLSPS